MGASQRLPRIRPALRRVASARRGALRRAASRAQRAWAGTSWDERERALGRLADVIAGNLEHLAAFLVLEQGKSLRAARWEIEGSADSIRVIARMRLPRQRLAERAGSEVALRHRPLGVIGAITPWNAPVMLGVAKIANSLLAGNAVLWKPSEYTPLTTLEIGRLARDVFPPGLFNVLAGAGDLGAAITTHPGIAKVSFTGSTRTGKRIAQAAGPQLKRLTLELGGNDAAIVLDDADPATVAPGIALLAFSNSGQYCSGIKRVFVPDALHDAMCDALAAAAARFVVGDGFDPATVIGPLQNRMQFERVCALTREALAAGGRALAGGEPLSRPGYFFPATVVAGLRDGVRLVDEEQFGPVMPVLRYGSLEEALQRANDSPYGLGGSIWTADAARGARLAERLDCGTAWVNQHGVLNVGTPMPLVKESGLGIEFGEAGLAEFTQQQVINVRC